MCSSRPKPSPPPAPPPPVQQTTIDEEVQREKSRERRRASSKYGRNSTILAGDSGQAPTVQSKTLLGQ